RRAPGGLKPGVLVGGVVDDQLDQDLEVARVRGVEKLAEVLEGAVARVHAGIVCDVVAVVTKRRRKEREQPEAGDAQLVKVVELFDQAAEVADAVPVSVIEAADVQ